MKDHTNTARLLIEKCADVNAKNEWKQMPLHLAAWNRHLDMVQMLDAATSKGHASRVTEGRASSGDKEVGR